MGRFDLDDASFGDHLRQNQLLESPSVCPYVRATNRDTAAITCRHGIVVCPQCDPCSCGKCDVPEDFKSRVESSRTKLLARKARASHRWVHGRCGDCQADYARETGRVYDCDGNLMPETQHCMGPQTIESIRGRW